MGCDYSIPQSVNNEIIESNRLNTRDQYRNENENENYKISNKTMQKYP